MSTDFVLPKIEVLEIHYNLPTAVRSTDIACIKRYIFTVPMDDGKCLLPNRI